MFQIGRFDNDAKKIQTPLDFLDNYANIECSKGKKEYEIVAYINQNGSNLYSGHYVSFIKNETDGEWYFYDDDYMRERKPSEIFNHKFRTHSTDKDAYLIVLKKAK